jgi:hypothetical protein
LDRCREKIGVADARQSELKCDRERERQERDPARERGSETTADRQTDIMRDVEEVDRGRE